MASSDSNTVAQDFLLPARQLLAHGRSNHALEYVRTLCLPIELSQYAQLLTIQALIDLGRLKEAALICESCLAATETSPRLSLELRARQLFIDLFLSGDFTTNLPKLRRLVWRARAEKREDLSLALLYELLGRSLALGVGWQLAPSSQIFEAQQLLAQAAELYRKTGSEAEAWNAEIEVGQLFTLGAKPNPKLAHSVLLGVVSKISPEAFPLRFLEANILLAELEYDQNIENQQTNPENHPRYAQALKFATQHEMTLGVAQIQFSIAQRMLRGGLDGLPMATEALQTFEREGSLKGIYGVLSLLAAHHLNYGQFNQTKTCLDQALRVSEQMGSPVFEAVTRLACSTYYLHRGEHAQALVESEKVLALAGQSVAVRAVASLSLANSFLAMNVPDKAQQCSKEAAQLLRRGGPTQSLSLAHFVLGNILSSQGAWNEAISAWRKAYLVDRQLQDFPAQIQKLQCLALGQVMQRSGSRGSKKLSRESANKHLRDAMRLTDLVSPPQAQQLRAAIEQTRGHLALVAGDLEAGISALKSARDYNLSLRLSLQVAFLEAQLGLLCYEGARSGSGSFLHEAAFFQENSLRFFENEQMLDLSWRMCFHRALTAVRCASHSEFAGEEQAHLTESLEWLRKSAFTIEKLKGKDSAATPHSAPAEEIRGITSDKVRVYTLAAQIQSQLRGNFAAALSWLERRARFESSNRNGLVNRETIGTEDKPVLERGREFFLAVPVFRSEISCALEFGDYPQILQN